MSPWLVTKFRHQKSENTPDENDDAYFFHPRVKGGCASSVDSGNLFVALADGATKSSFSGLWARMLTSWFAQHPPYTLEDFQSDLPAISARWHSKVSGRPLPWYTEASARRGASSTLVVLTVEKRNEDPRRCGTWHAMAVGDTCLFHVSKDSLKLTLPPMRAKDFDDTPPLLSSKLSHNEDIWGRVLFQEGNWSIGDYFLLATDALSAWFLEQNERDEHPWDILIGCTEEQRPARAFELWLAGMRKSHEIEDDDTTLICINV